MVVVWTAEHNILVYLEDSVAQLLEHREENPKVNAQKYLTEYFSALRDGNHTMFREYSFVRATSHNRASFVHLFWSSFKQIGERGDLLSIKEYHSLVQLLCPDFPFDVLQKTARIVLMDDALDCLIGFSDFLYAFQAQFYYEEFLNKATEIYKSLQQSQSSPRETVVVPSSTDDQPNVKRKSPPQSQDSVDSSLFFRMLYQTCDRAEFSVPSVDVLKELLDMPQVTYYSFLMFVAKSQRINEAIGRLPKKDELFEGLNRESSTSSIHLNSSKGNLVEPSADTTEPQQQKRPNGSVIKTGKGVISTLHRLRSAGRREITIHSPGRSSCSERTSDDSDGSTTD
ncbi:centriolar satellite-associated tubulin polyglutamylase complex regulator 1-like isoform X2 [Liolophura sinensis]|uniref:centriolar satellite-associated tubulin polyglutamylase complex regulator 1-like isoform X2 n=1 Tax=Liolophura sinensis TaxID=3198878 RepID=UPI003158AAEB